MKFDKRKDINPKYLLLTFTIICILFLVASFFAADQIKLVKQYTGKIIIPLQEGLNEIGLWTDSKLENIKKIEELNAENKKLKEEITTYKENITAYQNKLQELEVLRALYALDESYPSFNKVGAHVFAKDTSSWFAIFYIDKGSSDGVFEGANVMCGEGLAGIVIECNEDYSKVRAVIDDSTSISAKILPSNALCRVEGNLSVFQNGYIEVKNIDKDALVNIGDKVVTSQISERYHSGIVIGYVTEVTLDSNNLTMTAHITPAVDFSNISDVLIITDDKLTVEE